jgi:hypothetical protein
MARIPLLDVKIVEYPRGISEDVKVVVYIQPSILPDKELKKSKTIIWEVA